MRTSIGNRNVRRLASVILPLLAFAAAVVGGFGTREVAPEVPDALSPVYFAAGTTQMRPRDMRILDGHAAWLRSDGKRVLLIEGHTDEVGSAEYNKNLGLRRAQRVMTELAALGVDQARISTATQGEDKPLINQPTAWARAVNRRVEFEVRAK